MAVTTRARPIDPAPARHLAAPVRRRRVLPVAALLVGLAVGYLVSRDGTPSWQLARLVVVALVVAGAVAVVGGRSSAWARGAVAFTVGAVATAIGIGIGLPHLAKSGPVLMTAAGLLSLAGGLALLAGGAGLLVRATRRWLRPFVVVGLLAALVVVIYSVGQGVAATNVPRTDLDAATPADAGFAYRDVELLTSDGVTLSGWYVASENGAAVALLHGAGSTRSGVLDEAMVLAARGYGVLLFDARGHGRSEGRAMDFGWYGDLDAAAAVSFLAEQADVSAGRIALVGMSMGGEEAIGAAAADPRIQAVVAEGATNRVAGDKAWLSDEHGWRGTVQEGVERLVYGVADLLTEADPPITLRDAVAAAAPRPVLLIAGEDMPDEPLAGEHIVGGSPGTVELWVVADAGHTAGLETEPEEWERRVTAFLGEALEVAG